MASKNAVHDQLTHLQDQLLENDKTQTISDFEHSDKAEVGALRQVLSKLGWHGEDRHIYEALPQEGALHDIAEFRAILARLNFETELKKINPTELNEDFLPCLYVADGHKTQIILELQANQLKVLDVSSNHTETIPVAKLKGKIFQISAVDIEAQRSLIAQHGWMGMLTRNFWPLFVQLLGVTLLSNIMALGLPIYIMSVYDKVIATASTAYLGYLFAGIAIVMAADFSLRLIRARMMAYLGARFDAILNLAAFQQILHLPVSMTESPSAGTQISRFKQFEDVREVFTNPLGLAMLDTPFILIYLSAIMILGGVMVLVPVTVMVIFAIAGALAFPRTKKQIAMSGEIRVQSQNFLHELAAKQASLREEHEQNAWLARFRKTASKAALAHFHSQQTSHISQVLSQSMVLIAAVACLGIGATRIMAGDMTGGALIAVLALVWRALFPLQAILANLSGLPQMMISYRQINHLMQLKPEQDPRAVSIRQRDFSGDVSVRNVSFRYTPSSDPALTGLSLDIPPGQLIAIAGPNGSGKSTLINIIMGLYPVQAGAVYFDGLDIRQLDMGLLRHAIALVPQKIALFKDTIEQNIRIAHPQASLADIERALKQANVFEAVETLPQGLQTQLTDDAQRQLPDDLKQRLMLARAYVKSAPVYLLDEPVSGLDQSDDQAFCAKLETLRGKSTVIMATHKQSHMKLCDRVIYLERGQLIHDGKPEQVLPLIEQMN